VPEGAAGLEGSALRLLYLLLLSREAAGNLNAARGRDGGGAGATAAARRLRGLVGDCALPRWAVLGKGVDELLWVGLQLGGRGEDARVLAPVKKNANSSLFLQNDQDRRGSNNVQTWAKCIFWPRKSLKTSQKETNEPRGAGSRTRDRPSQR
jgi:hypothetical protein